MSTRNNYREKDAMKRPTIAIIGAGTVGVTTAYTLIQQQNIAKIILIDINEIRCKGEIDDLTDALSFNPIIEVSMGTLKDAAQADIVIITAGLPQKPGQSRLDLLDANHKIIKSIVQGMEPINPNLIMIMVTNPVDILTFVAQQYSGLPKQQIFGSGTLLDTQRLRSLVSKKIGIAPSSIELYVMGEHGDNQMVSWSTATVAGKPLSQLLDSNEFEGLAKQARDKAYNIIACKGSTSYGVATCIATYCNNIIFDTKAVMPVSCYVEQFDICINVPAAIGQKGVEQIIMPSLDKEEVAALQKAAKVLQEHIKGNS